MGTETATKWFLEHGPIFHVPKKKIHRLSNQAGTLCGLVVPSGSKDFTLDFLPTDAFCEECANICNEMLAESLLEDLE